MQLASLGSLQWNYIVGGLAIFLYGISLMGNALTNFAGPKLRKYVEKYTSNPIMGVLVGVIITGLIQSSSATTVITISFIRAGVMSLEQAIGVILGANIGTTVTAILIGFNLEYLSYFIIFIGVILFTFSSKRKNKSFGEILIGFGLLFIGLEMMGSSLAELKNIESFDKFVANMAKNPIFAVLTGALLTAIIQSSSAFIGITQSLYASGAIDINVALGLMFGANIGTCITAVLASVGGSLSAKRASVFHIIFNVSVSIVFLILLEPYKNIILTVADAIGANKLMIIALGHFAYNFIGVLIFLPLNNIVAKLLSKLIPGKESLFLDLPDIELDENLITKFPSGAIDQVKQAIWQEANVALETIKQGKKFLVDKDKNALANLQQAEEIVNDIDTKVQSYLLKLGKNTPSTEIEGEVQNLLQIQINVERISDLGQNLGEYFEEVNESDNPYHGEALADLVEMYNMVINNFIRSIEIFKNQSQSEFRKLTEDEGALDLMESTLRKHHYKRLQKNENIRNMATYVFNDIISTMERMGDHAYNIGRITTNPVKIHKEPHGKFDD